MLLIEATINMDTKIITDAVTMVRPIATDIQDTTVVTAMDTTVATTTTPTTETTHTTKVMGTTIHTLVLAYT